MKDSHSDFEIREILGFRNVAVVGISRDQTKPSYYVSKYLVEHGYNVIPVNPFANQVLGRKCFAGLPEIQDIVDIVQVFRPSGDVQAVVESAISKRPKVIWLQEGIHDADAEAFALKNGFEVVWNRCMMKEHARLLGGKPRAPLSQA